MNVAIIPARGGSKRIHRKNVKIFCGKPIIAWVIEIALQSECFDQVVVSTDDDEIAQIARDFGAMTPFKRPRELSNDFATTRSVIAHAIPYIEKLVRTQLATICCMYPTAPLLRPKDLVRARELLVTNSQVESIFSIVRYHHPIQRSLQMSELGLMNIAYPDKFYERTQDLKSFYHDAGQFYMGSPESFTRPRSTEFGNRLGYVLPKFRAIDIDTDEDWLMAEAVFEYLHKAESSGTE